MNRAIKVLFLLLLAIVVPVSAKAHSATITFIKSTDDAGLAGQGYTAYRLTGACPVTPPTTTAGFTSLNATLFTGTSYVDNTVVPGQYCYLLTFTSGSASSGPSNTASGTILPSAPTAVTIGATN